MIEDIHRHQPNHGLKPRGLRLEDFVSNGEASAEECRVPVVACTSCDRDLWEGGSGMAAVWMGVSAMALVILTVTRQVSFLMAL